MLVFSMNSRLISPHFPFAFHQILSKLHSNAKKASNCGSNEFAKSNAETKFIVSEYSIEFFS